MKAISAYIPVIHQGYISFLERHLPAHILLLSAEAITQFDSVIADQLSRDIRAVSVKQIKSMLQDVYPRTKIRVFESIEDLKEYDEIIMLDEDVSRSLQKHVPWAKVEFDTAFLRWDWSKANTVKEVVGKFPISNDPYDYLMISRAEGHAGKSSDIWRHVGAAIKIADRVILEAHNEHMPNPRDPYDNGDPRLVMKPGERPDICTAIHAEQSIIAQAAKEGLKLDGLSMYVTTFPCAPCSRSIVKAGIKKLFFKEGYSNLDALEVLMADGIEIFQVK
jgi:dCMP deaminase